MRNEKEYALYRGDEFVEIGTLEALAKVLNISKKDICFFKTPSYKKRFESIKNNRRSIALVCVNDHKNLDSLGGILDEIEGIEMLGEWNQIYHDVYEDVNWDNCSRATQNNLKELNKIYRETELENKLLKNEILRLFDRLCDIVEYTQRFDMNYLENWLKEQKNENR